LQVDQHMDPFSSQDLGRLRDTHMTGSPVEPGCGETFYQGTSMLFGWDLEIPPDATRNLSLSFHLVL
ncbi:MAG: hypothetical protein LLF89_01130, partial [Spirochaetaceae bacterium]|nr:hypothetical protein [Spirochaetaceae bacterium]